MGEGGEGRGGGREVVVNNVDCGGGEEMRGGRGDVSENLKLSVLSAELGNSVNIQSSCRIWYLVRDDTNYLRG